MADETPDQTEASTQPQASFWQQLRAGEYLWAWKFGIRLVISVLDVIGIGCAAWLISITIHASIFGWSIYDEGLIYPWLLVPVSLSFIWCLIGMLVSVLRRPPRPVHPGLAVAFDLILWLAFVVTTIIAVAAMLTSEYFGSDNYISDPGYSSGYSGHYELDKHDTWVYHVDSVYSGYGYGRNISSAERDCLPNFSSCKRQDQYVNMLWDRKQGRRGVEIVVALVQCVNLLLHLTLFVWACVDTHRVNRVAKEGRVQAIADKVIRDMEAKGLITVHTQVQARTGPEIAESSRAAHASG